MKRATLLIIILLAFSILGTSQALATPWADILDQEFTFIVGWAAGGSNDLSARIMASGLTQLGIDVTVVNMPGAVGTEAAAFVSRQPADENVMFWGTPMTLFYEPAKRDVGWSWEDFDPVGTMGGPTFCIATHVDTPWETLDEVIEYGLENPGMLIFGGQGELTQMHHTISMIFDSAGVDLRYVPFAGGADVAKNLAGRHADIGHLSLAAAYPLHVGEDIRILAHTSNIAERVGMAPEIPNIAEYGFPNAQEPMDMMLWAPKGASAAVRESLSEAMKEVLTFSDIQERMGDLGILIQHKGPSELLELTENLHETIIKDFTQWYQNY